LRGGEGHRGVNRLWPAAGDEAVLRSALGDGADAIEAWKSWHGSANYADLDPAWHRLLPPLHENLKRLGVSDPAMEHYRKVFRFFWFKNQVLFRKARLLGEALQSRGIPVLFLKGMPLALQFYGHAGLRPMNDVDVLVRREDVPAVLEHLAGSGWSCCNTSVRSLARADRLVRVRHGLNFRHADGQQVDVHWELTRHCFAGSGSLWAEARPLVVDGVALQTLSPTDHLLHAFVQGAEWDGMSPIRWVVDARMILVRGGVDWGRLVEQARRFEMGGVAADGLEVVGALGGLAVPAETVAELRRIPLSTWARLDHRFSSRPPLPVVGKPWRRYLRYRRTRAHGPAGFVRYLEDFWGVEGLAAVLREGLRRLRSEAAGAED